MKIGDLVLIRWEDSKGCPMGWQVLDDARSTAVAVIESVGWVVAKDERAVQIAPHVAVEGVRCIQGHMAIPRSCILTKKTLVRA